MFLCRLESVFIDTPEEDYEQYLFEERLEEHMYDEEITQQRFEENLAEMDYMDAEIQSIINTCEGCSYGKGSAECGNCYVGGY